MLKDHWSHRSQACKAKVMWHSSWLGERDACGDIVCGHICGRPDLQVSLVPDIQEVQLRGLGAGELKALLRPSLLTHNMKKLWPLINPGL